MRNVGIMGPPPIDRKKSRLGCAGCLTRVMLTLLLGCVLIIAMDALFYPWSFYLGGHLHTLPVWQGIGRMHSASGDYVIYFWVEPTRGGRTFNLPSFKGKGYLCTPRGARFPLRAYAGLNEKTGTDTNGKAFHLSLSSWPWYWNFTGTYDRRPVLEFRGRWQNPDLVMDDGGTLAGAFLADGALSPVRYNYYHADSKNKVEVTFHEVTGFQAWSSDCRVK